MAACDDFLVSKVCDRRYEVQVAINQCRILFYMGKANECVTRGIEALAFFEDRLMNLLNDPGAVSAYEKELLDGIIMATQTVGIAESFKRLAVLKDDFLLAAHSLLLELIAPCAWAAPHLLHTLPLIGVLLTFQHGKCVQSAVHVVCYFGFSDY
jgi:hypothetical protein